MEKSLSPCFSILHSVKGALGMQGQVPQSPPFPTLPLRYQSPVANETKSSSLPAEEGNRQWLCSSPAIFLSGIKDGGVVASHWARESSLMTFPAENPLVTFLCLSDKIQNSHHEPWGLFPPGLPVTQAEVCARLWPSPKFCVFQYQVPAIQPIWQDLPLVPPFLWSPLDLPLGEASPDRSLYTRAHDYKFED